MGSLVSRFVSMELVVSIFSKGFTTYLSHTHGEIDPSQQLHSLRIVLQVEAASCECVTKLGRLTATISSVQK